MIKRLNKACRFFPCHKGLEDCTFCYCPFYPCLDENLGNNISSKNKKKKIWSCQDCNWIHKKKTVDCIFSLIRTYFVKTVLILFLFVWCDAFAQQTHPRRIVSSGPSITKALYLLGAENELIANTVHCVYPQAAKDKEKIGTVVQVNIEKIFSLKPDLVLATSLTNPRAKEKLENLGIRVVTLSTPRDFSGLCRQFLELGGLAGKETIAEEVVKKAENGVTVLRKRVENLVRPKVFVQVGAKPLVAATGNYFVNDYIEFAGGVNIAKGVKDGIYSKEQVIKDNPDVIIITRMGIAAETEKKDWQNFKTLNAVKSNRIYIVDSDEWTSPTPESFVRTLEEIVHILHPEI